MQWAQKQDSGLKTRVEHGQVGYELRTITRELEVAQALVEKSITESEAKAFLNESKACSFQVNYDLSYWGKDIYHVPVLEDWNSDELRSYLAFGMKKDIVLLSQTGDSLPCVSVQQEALMSGIPRASFLLDFGNVALQNCKQLLIRDRLFTNEWVKIPVNALKKNQQPKLSI